MLIINRYADYLQQPLPERFPKKLRSITKINPAKAGDIAPLFAIHGNQYIEQGGLLQSEAGITAIQTLLTRPVVIAFYSIHWNDYSNRLLSALQGLAADIKVMGGQLLLLSAEDKSFWQQEASLQNAFPIAHDTNNKIARKFGIYAESDPIWDRVSGINADVPIPAVYVISPLEKITFDFTDPYFEKELPTRELLTAVYNTTGDYIYRKAQ
jgi:peroxiredoxin